MGPVKGNQDEAFYMGYLLNNQFICANWNDDLIAPAIYTADAGQWIHWSCNVNQIPLQPLDRRLYRNGVLVANNVPGQNLQVSGPLFIGYRLGVVSSLVCTPVCERPEPQCRLLASFVCPQIPWIGALDEIAVWQRQLSASETLALATLNVGHVSATKLVLWLPFSNGMLVDLSNSGLSVEVLSPSTGLVPDVTGLPNCQPKMCDTPNESGDGSAFFYGARTSCMVVNNPTFTLNSTSYTVAFWQRLGSYGQAPGYAFGFGGGIYLDGSFHMGYKGATGLTGGSFTCAHFSDDCGTVYRALKRSPAPSDA